MPILPMPRTLTITTAPAPDADAATDEAMEAVLTPAPALDPDRTYPVEIRLLSGTTVYKERLPSLKTAGVGSQVCGIPWHALVAADCPFAMRW